MKEERDLKDCVDLFWDTLLFVRFYRKLLRHQQQRFKSAIYNR